MRQTPIHAVDHIPLPLSPTEIWPVLADISRYPQWWPKLLRVRVMQSTPALIGSELELRPLGAKRFSCQVVSFVAPERIDLEYRGGVIEGTAKWRLEPAGQGTRVSYAIDVLAKGRLVALVGRILDLNTMHSLSMQAIFRNLRRELFPQQNETQRPSTGL